MNSEHEWISDLFAAIDQRDPDRFAEHLHDDVRFVFGNAEPLYGRESARSLVAAFFTGIAGLTHQIRDTLASGSIVSCRGRVVYTRLDGSELDVPFANFFELSAGKIISYEIYTDTSRL